MPTGHQLLAALAKLSKSADTPSAPILPPARATTTPEASIATKDGKPEKPMPLSNVALALSMRTGELKPTSLNQALGG